MKRTIGPVMLTAALFVGTDQALAAPAWTPYFEPAGTWHVTSDTRCANSLANAHVCSALLGSNWVVIGVPNTTLTIHSTADITVDSTGKFLAEATTVATERAPRFPGIACDSQPFGSRGFTGTCTWYSWYHGNTVVRKNHSILFRARTQAFAFQRYVAPQFNPCSCRLLFPKPGIYLTRKLLEMQGLSPTAAALVGVDARMVVTHTGAVPDPVAPPVPPIADLAQR